MEHKKDLLKKEKIAEAIRNSQRLSLWLIQPDIFEHKYGLAAVDQVTSVNCVSDDDNLLLKTSVIRQKPFP